MHAACIVHGDTKPANIMLTRLIEHGAEPKTMQVIVGTAGYIDPEFVCNSRRCPELDVYSFGIVLLEIACGNRPTVRLPNEAPPLLAWVLDMYRDQSRIILDAADRRLNGQFDQHQMQRVLPHGSVVVCASRSDAATIHCRSHGFPAVCR